MRIILTFLLNAGLNFAVGLVIASALGPERYGAFALGMTAAALVATGLFDWLRLCTTRFYGETQRQRDPSIRRTIGATYAALALVLALMVGASALLPIPATVGFVAAVAFMAVASGVFDYRTALARARFLNGPYTVMVLGKGALGLALALGAGWLGRDPTLVLAAQAAGMLIAVLPVSHLLRDDAPASARVELGLLRRFARYGLPVVAANVVFQGIALAVRSFAAGALGFAAAGHLSLATDLELRLLLASGAAIDVLVFQLAVRQESVGGSTAAEAQLRSNMVVVTASLTLLAVGFAMTLPAFVALVVPTRFQDGFAPLALTLLPGFFLFCLGQFALNPVFQMQHRTMPIIGAALVSAATIAGGLGVGHGAFGPLGLAAMHAGGLAAGFVALALMAFRTQALRPRLRDVFGIAAAAGVMAVCLWPLRAIEPPLLSLALAGLVGPIAYGMTLVACDVGGCRRFVRPWLPWMSGSIEARRLA